MEYEDSEDSGVLSGECNVKERKVGIVQCEESSVNCRVWSAQ